jgi:hypothetical protein
MSQQTVGVAATHTPIGSSLGTFAGVPAARPAAVGETPA